LSEQGWVCSIQVNMEETMHRPQTIIPHLSSWLKMRRWSGLIGADKLETRILDSLILDQGPDFVISVAFVEVNGFKGGERIRKRFFLPLFLKHGQGYESGYKEREALINCTDGRITAIEAELTPHYNTQLLKAFQEEKAIQTTRGGFVEFEQTSDPKLRIDHRKVVSKPIVLGGADTTNIVVKISIDDHGPLVFKSYKAIAEVNPEPEFLMALADLEFRFAPEIRGRIIYKPPGGESVVVGIVENLIESDGDGGKPFMDDLVNRLQNILEKRQPQDSDFSDIQNISRNLGEIIAEFHYAIHKYKKKSFKPELITLDDIERRFQKIKKMLWEIPRGVEAVKDDRALTPLARRTTLTLAERVGASEKEVMEHMKPLVRTVGMDKIRTHQDLHLAQMISKRKGSRYNFFIIDFEGDPQRSGSARREKEHPFRDLGTVARSFGYIKFFSLAKVMCGVPLSQTFAMVASVSEKERKHENSRHTIDIEPDPTLEDVVRYANRWEEKVEEAMLDGYLQRSRHLMAPYIPLSESDGDLVRSVVTAWKIEKALLETIYELSHRIQNIIIPLDGILACIDRYP